MIAVPADDEADDVLLAAIARREEAALQSLYGRYGGAVYAIAQRLTGDHHLAQEIVQDVFMRCWDRVATFDSSRGTVREWVIGIARNRSIDMLRSANHHARAREVTDQLAGFVVAGASGSTEAVALTMTVVDALSALPLPQREALTLAYYGGMTQSQVARHLDVPLGTVKSRIRDGMARLRSVMKAEDYRD